MNWFKKKTSIPEELKHADCFWEGCERKNAVYTGLQVVQVLESGNVQPVQNTMVPIPLCKYHFILVSTGKFGIQQDPENPQMYSIYGPFEVLDLIETVLKAQESLREQKS